MIKQLIKLANSFDQLGLYKQANWIDQMINDISDKEGEVSFNLIGRKAKLKDQLIQDLHKRLNRLIKLEAATKEGYDYGWTEQSITQEVQDVKDTIKEIQANDNIGTIVKQKGLDYQGYELIFKHKRLTVTPQQVEIL